MPLNVTNVRAAMANVLDVAYGTQVQIATAPDQITPPCLLIGMPSLEYHGSFTRRGIDGMTLPVYGILPRTHDQAAVDLADRWVSGIGPESLLVVLEADQTLGGACATLVVKSATAELWQSTNGPLPDYHWTVEVHG
jgi:hypothetical protein